MFSRMYKSLIVLHVLYVYGLISKCTLCSPGVWVDLPELNPLRAQHGCALVELNGRQGVLVVGGDSGNQTKSIY